MATHDLDGPPQVQHLLAHLASACDSDDFPVGRSDAIHDTACRETAA